MKKFQCFVKFLILLFLTSSTSLLAATFVYVANEGTPSISVIDPTTNLVVDTILLNPSETPVQIAIPPGVPRAYISTDTGHVIVVDTNTNLVIDTIVLPLSVVSAEAIAATPDGSAVYVTAVDPTFSFFYVFAISTSTNTVTATIPPSGIATAASPQGIAITPNGQFAYIPNRTTSTVVVIDISTNTVFTTIPIPGIPTEYDVAITPDGKFAYVTHFAASTVVVISTSSNTVVNTISLPYEPSDIVITPDGKTAYMIGNAVFIMVLDIPTSTIVTSIPVANTTDLAVTPDGKFVYAAQFAGQVAVIDTSTNGVVTTIPLPGAVFTVGIAITPPPPPPAIPPVTTVAPAAAQILAQSEQLIYKTMEENFESLQYSGLMSTTEGTFQDLQKIYIINGETMWTNEVHLTPSWCP